MSDQFYPMNDPEIPIWQWGVRKPFVVGSNTRSFMNKSVMYKNLLDFKESCDKYKLEFVIIFGSLLGLIREGDLIDTDTDIDVMCIFKDYNHWKEHYKFGYVIEDMKKKGFYVPDRNFSPMTDIGFTRGGEKIEIWIFNDIDDEKIYNNIVRFPAHYFNPLDEIDFLGTKFKIPNNPKSFLEHTYGPTWTEKRPNGAYILAQYKH
jgi:lipopolysaccharide cholinephosphotransferase